MDEQLRQTVRERADHRCEYCCLPQDAEPFFAYHVEHIVARQRRRKSKPPLVSLWSGANWV